MVDMSSIKSQLEKSKISSSDIKEILVTLGKIASSLKKTQIDRLVKTLVSDGKFVDAFVKDAQAAAKERLGIIVTIGN
jgi:hypothetical protein